MLYYDEKLKELEKEKHKIYAIKNLSISSGVIGSGLCATTGYCLMHDNPVSAILIFATGGMSIATGIVLSLYRNQNLKEIDEEMQKCKDAINAEEKAKIIPFKK